MRNYQIPLAVATNYKSAGGLNLSPSLTDSLSYTLAKVVIKPTRRPTSVDDTFSLYPCTTSGDDTDDNAA